MLNSWTFSEGLEGFELKTISISQDPVLFTGSMRKNLDPFSQHTDEELWNALREVRRHNTAATATS